MASKSNSRYFVQRGDELVEYESRSVLVGRYSSFKVVQLHILKDGSFELDGSPLTKAELLSAITEGNVRTSIPAPARVSVPNLIGFSIDEVVPVVEEQEFVKEVADVQRSLNGELTTSELCRIAFESFTREPTEENREKLRTAYKAVPAHLDCWLLGPSLKDVPIREALGEQG